MTAEVKANELNVDRDLLEHRTHLPETVSCICGYQREDATAPGTLAA